MTRNEEIQKLIDEETGTDNYGSSDYQVGVSEGVRLADNTMIEKACEWIKNNIRDYMMTREGEFLDSFEEMCWIDDMFGDLKEKMKEV